jgi:hypothetical protein
LKGLGEVDVDVEELLLPVLNEAEIEVVDKV